MPPTWFQLELTRPYWLLGLAVLPVLAFYFRRSLVDFPRWQKALSLSARSVIVILLVLALAGLTLLKPTREKFVVFAVDRSLSVGDDSRKAAEAFVADAVGRAGTNRVASLSFGNEPGLVQAGAAQAASTVDDKGTNIAAAIEVAAAAIPPFYVPEIVLLSDGNQTSGDALKAALRAGVPIATVPLKTRQDPDVQVSAVNVPPQVQQGEPFNVEVVIDSNQDQNEGEIEVYRGALKVVSEHKKLKKGENRFRFRQTIENERLATFTARTKGFVDRQLDNNSDFGLVFTAGKPRVLVVESDPKVAKDLAWALEEQEMQVDVRPPQGMPDSLADLQNYELLILSNVPATALSMRQMEVARTYVQDLGGGLIMLGGDQSFGLGGYYKTVLEEILPVRSDFEKEKEKPSLAMVLVIDKSGSMGGDKIEMAKEAAKSAVELLGANDKVGVIAFEGETYWVSEIHPCSDKGFVLDRISSIEAGGGTSMYPAMEEAYEALHKTVAKLKHVIILTDGISEPGDFEGISQTMAGARMTVSTVGVGEGADQDLLENIARIGGGRNYFVEDPFTIPQIFAKETVAASKSAINEQPFLPQVVRPTQALSEIDFASAPFLLGYVITRPKATSEIILATESGDPLLTWWRYGLGMCVAFTSDAKSRWAAEWISWPGFGKFWAQVVRHAMRKSETKGIVMQVETKSRHASVSLDSVDPSGRFINQAETELTVIDPQFGNRKLPMTQSAPGRYVAEFDTPYPGSYHLEFAQKSQGKVLYHQSRGLAVGYPDELRLRPTNTELLQQVARASGGRFDPSAATIFAPSDRTALRALPLWPYLIAVAAVLFVVEVALRRVDLSLAISGWRRGNSVSFLRN
ncbi:MAG TPA: VWA domain-containing protein [Isosphaeraceae bacterium]|nr:VWA domain-containing protein [Isosphaeraceae bacterium]